MLRDLMCLTPGVVLCAAVAHADIVQLQPSADNTLFESVTGNLSNGLGAAMFAGRNSGSTNSTRRAVVRFDIAGSIPAGATITSVVLQLTEAGNNTADQSISLHRLTESWGEGTSVSGGSSGGGGGAPATTGDATWLHRFFNTQTWSSPGGAFDAVASATSLVGGPGVYTWSSAALIADAQSFLDVPSADFGWIILGNESSPSTAKRFGTRESTDEALRPLLTITYIPSPSAAGPMVAMIIAGGSRRRRPFN